MLIHMVILKSDMTKFATADTTWSSLSAPDPDQTDRIFTLRTGIRRRSLEQSHSH